MGKTRDELKLIEETIMRSLAKWTKSTLNRRGIFELYFNNPTAGKPTIQKLIFSTKSTKELTKN
eukprot:snap_masked-scaffold_5-processed-gene-8.49-mRNA-1 protein AED:1.00 eAED:1.00 QI:0/-1/0/0/-1/1/1/0/63